MELTVYRFEDEHGTLDTYTSQNFRDADEYACRAHRKLIAMTYEYTDSEELADYTEAVNS